jgi:hypothetical protein
VLLLAIGVAIYLMRRRKKDNSSPVAQAVELKEKDSLLQSKAQLHADSLVLHELDGEVSPKAMPELPVSEPVGSELPQWI